MRSDPDQVVNLRPKALNKIKIKIKIKFFHHGKSYLSITNRNEISIGFRDSQHGHHTHTANAVVAGFSLILSSSSVIRLDVIFPYRTPVLNRPISTAFINLGGILMNCQNLLYASPDLWI